MDPIVIFMDIVIIKYFFRFVIKKIKNQLKKITKSKMKFFF